MKKRKDESQRLFYMNLQRKDGLGVEFIGEVVLVFDT